MIVQNYLTKPLLIDSYKFDLRVYVLVTSVDPFRVFIHKDGLARFATEKYVGPSEVNLQDVCMHLTNYAINKRSSNFDHSTAEDRGSKRTLASVLNLLKEKYGQTKADVTWARIADVIIKTLITVQPQLRMILKACFPSRIAHSTSSNGNGSNHDSKPSSKKFKLGSTQGSQCFEILGFDVMLDHKLKPWVLEVNHSPSFNCDSELDTIVKEKVIGDTFELLNLSGSSRKKYEREERQKIKLRLLGAKDPGKEGTGGSGGVGASNNINGGSTTLNGARSPTPPAMEMPPFILGQLVPEPEAVQSDGDNDNNNDDGNEYDDDDEDDDDDDDEDDDFFLGRSSQTTTLAGSTGSGTGSKTSTPKSKDSSTATATTMSFSAPPDIKQLLETFQSPHPTAYLEALTKYEDAHMGSFQRIFPPNDIQRLARYAKCFAAASKISADTAATKGRQDHIRKMKEMEEMKSKKIDEWRAKVRMNGVAGSENPVKSRLMSWRKKSAKVSMERLLPWRIRPKSVGNFFDEQAGGANMAGAGGASNGLSLGQVLYGSSSRINSANARYSTTSSASSITRVSSPTYSASDSGYRYRNKPELRMNVESVNDRFDKSLVYNIPQQIPFGNQRPLSPSRPSNSLLEMGANGMRKLTRSERSYILDNTVTYTWKSSTTLRQNRVQHREENTRGSENRAESPSGQKYVPSAFGNLPGSKISTQSMRILDSMKMVTPRNSGSVNAQSNSGASTGGKIRHLSFDSISGGKSSSIANFDMTTPAYRKNRNGVLYGRSYLASLPQASASKF
ncbi:Tubulin polyglutamylase ttll6 [Blyttiomyces sp. JEL0837]|nr:Tubulin polyglutamylase ttll6 [Blyttiomyces sp. JEL0837]